MNIIEIAKQAHRKLVTEVYVGHMGQLDPWTIELLKIFADLIAAHEREACAKFCETNQVWVGKGKRGFSEWGEDEFVTGGIHQGMDYAAAIRARGTT
jgi:hypothetical protein